MNAYVGRVEAILYKIDQLALFSETASGITRTFGSQAFLGGSRLIRQWMEDIGLQTRVDTMGNVRGLWMSSNEKARTFVIASHMDTVVNAGKFDGPLGVIMGLDLIAQLIQIGEPLPFHIELIAFSDEEGVRFHTTYLGSKVIAGSFDETLLEKKDALGTSLGDVIRSMGGEPRAIPSEAIPSQEWLGYFEIHIEQGPVLHDNGIPVAVVTDIAGQKRVEVNFMGTAGHAGTVPMAMRQDAVCAASEFILDVERLANRQANLVATVGKVTVVNAASNVIPGEVVCSLDVRSNDGEVLATAYQALQDSCRQIGRRRDVSVAWKLIQETAPVACDTRLTSLLANSIAESGYEVVRLVSGAGHDGVPISDVAPIAMLFVRCFKGISHNPLEHVERADLAAALTVADQFMSNLIRL